MAASRLKQYGYINAKLRTRISTVLTKDQFERLLRVKSVNEVLSELKATEYEYLQPVYAIATCPGSK